MGARFPFSAQRRRPALVLSFAHRAPAVRRRAAAADSHHCAMRAPRTPAGTCVPQAQSSSAPPLATCPVRASGAGANKQPPFLHPDQPACCPAAAIPSRASTPANHGCWPRGRWRQPAAPWHLDQPPGAWPRCPCLPSHRASAAAIMRACLPVPPARHCNARSASLPAPAPQSPRPLIAHQAVSCVKINGRQAAGNGLGQAQVNAQLMGALRACAQPAARWRVVIGGWTLCNAAAGPAQAGGLRCGCSRQAGGRGGQQREPGSAMQVQAAATLHAKACATGGGRAARTLGSWV